MLRVDVTRAQTEAEKKLADSETHEFRVSRKVQNFALSETPNLKKVPFLEGNSHFFCIFLHFVKSALFVSARIS